MQKRKKKQKNRVEFGLKNITPGKHERTGNLNYFSEEIAKELIDKIISLSMTKIFREKINSKITDFCFESVERFLNLALSISNINHDKDNIYDIENISDEKKRLNTDENSYKILNHQRCNKVRQKLVEEDMFEYTNINLDFREEMLLKNKKIEDYLNKSVEIDTIINRKKNEKSNYWGIISQPNSFGPQRFAPKSNMLNKEILLNNENRTAKKEGNRLESPKKNNRLSKIKTLLSKKLSFSSFSVKDNESKIENNDKNEFISKKERKYLILEMDKMKKIEEYMNRNEEPEDIKELRKLEIEKIKYLKEEEEKIKAVKKLATQNNTKLEYDLDSINLTAQEKARNVQSQRKFIEEQIRKGNFTLDFNNNIILVRQVKPDNLEKDFPEAISKQKVKEKGKEISKENKENQSQSGNDTNEKSKTKNLIEEKNKANVISYFNYNYGWKVDPSGSNFKLIKPEVGVTIHEGNEIKSGGNHFYEKFKRFSIKDYSEMLKEIIDQKNMGNIFLKKRIEEENKKNSPDNIKKNKMNNSNEISKIKRGLNPFNQNIKKLNIKMKKKMNKSQSEIFTKNKASLYDNLLVREEKNAIKRKKNNESAYTHRINPNNLFVRRMKNIRDKNNNLSLKMVDTFNKSIIIQKFEKLGIEKEDMKPLPIIPLKKNRSDIFEKRNQFSRTRVNKSIKINLFD